MTGCNSGLFHCTKFVVNADRIRRMYECIGSSIPVAVSANSGAAGVLCRLRTTNGPTLYSNLTYASLCAWCLTANAFEWSAGAKAKRRRGTAAANSLGRVVLAVWTTAGLVSAARPPAKSAGAACGHIASAERSGLPGLLNVGRGQ
jgi:hypothetical protein